MTSMALTEDLEVEVTAEPHTPDTQPEHRESMGPEHEDAAESGTLEYESWALQSGRHSTDSDTPEDPTESSGWELITQTFERAHTQYPLLATLVYLAAGTGLLFTLLFIIVG